MRLRTIAVTISLLVLTVCCSSGASEPHGLPVPTAADLDAVSLDAPGGADAPTAYSPPGGSTPIDGRWRLSRLLDTPIPRIAYDLVYTFEEGRGSFTKNGEPQGDGFTYSADSQKISLAGAEEEALLDAGTGEDRYHHYRYTISGDTMTWWVPDAFSSEERKNLYVFERR